MLVTPNSHRGQLQCLHRSAEPYNIQRGVRTGRLPRARTALGRFYPCLSPTVIRANSNSKTTALQGDGEEVMYQKWTMGLAMTPPQPGGSLGSYPS